MQQPDSLHEALKKIRQDPRTPHPGTITLRYLWNHSERVERASDWPESIIFFCVNDKHEEVPRNQAKWCIPLVEFETLSVDEKGNSVPPREASFIERFEYGPDHTFLRSVSTPPVRVPPPELRAPPPSRAEPERQTYTAPNRTETWLTRLTRWIRSV
ncbi:hypothetical protein AB4851_32935 [Burkholderia sp. 22PA0099]|uniref:hypothetical protein n=1 Tax=Burkholderia sp. 22PA0099 TaxID=3237372 RepID=UPI0039C21779